jgi:hypothetical protein
MALADPAKAASFTRFFKTDDGQYAEGDRFPGIAVPGIQRLAGKLSWQIGNGCSILITLTTACWPF